MFVAVRPAPSSLHCVIPAIVQPFRCHLMQEHRPIWTWITNCAFIVAGAVTWHRLHYHSRFADSAERLKYAILALISIVFFNLDWFNAFAGNFCFLFVNSRHRPSYYSHACHYRDIALSGSFIPALIAVSVDGSNCPVVTSLAHLELLKISTLQTRYRGIRWLSSAD